MGSRRPRRCRCPRGSPGRSAGRRSSTLPGAGAKPRSGSSALTRASIACPRAAGGSPSSRPPAATWSCSLTRSRPVVASVTGCSTWRRVLTSRKARRSLLGLIEELDGADVAVPGRRDQVDRGAPQRHLLLRRPAPATPTPRSASGCGAGPSSRARRPPRPCRSRRDHLHLDVARAGHEPLHQHARVAEGPPGLGARPLEGGQQLGLRVHAPDPAARRPRRPP